MVLLVHGAPWFRNVWALSPDHQWLADRGYAVLSVNYRGGWWRQVNSPIRRYLADLPPERAGWLAGLRDP
jgi:dipeptidyl aminopeptidase/acylaminoacyl peptidase